MHSLFRTSVWTAMGLLAVSGCANIPLSAREPVGSKKIDPAVSMARLCETQGNPAKAREIYSSILKSHPKAAEPHHRLGVMAGRDGDLVTATAHLDKAVDLNPNDPEVLTDRAYVHYLASRFDQAEADARAALKHRPTDQRARINLALTVGSQGRMEEAYELFRAALGESEAHSNIAYLHMQQGDIERAKASYLKAVELNPQNRKAAEALVQVHKLEQQALAAKLEKARSPGRKESNIIQVSAEEEQVSRKQR